MTENPLIIQFAVFASVSAAASLLILFLTRTESCVQERLNDLSDPGRPIVNLPHPANQRAGTLAQAAKMGLQKLGMRLLPDSEAQHIEKRFELVRAGVYAPSARSVLVATKFVLTLLPWAAGILTVGLGVASMNQALMAVCPASFLGLSGPGLWLNWKKNKRQATLRRSLPDFLDVIVVCLESGMSFESSLQRTSDELREAHPLLASELAIVQREIAVGRAVDDALQNFAMRTDLSVIKILATNVMQARRLGLRMAENLRIHAETLRTQREQRAEEMAQKAAVKILFPTLFFIFPAIFVVLVGPAALQIRGMFSPSGDRSPTVAAELTSPNDRPSRGRED